MAPGKLPYQEGTWFAVPLADSGYAVGLAARIDGSGTVFGYFFGPKHKELPSLDHVMKLRHEDAVERDMFGDLGLIEGSWPVLGKLPGWKREDWPLPAFGRLDSISSHIALRITYSDDLELISEVRCDPEEARQLLQDGLSGAGVVENHLSYRFRDITRDELPYQEGTWFAASLFGGGYVPGVVARLDGKGTVFGFFFGPKSMEIPTWESVQGLVRSRAIHQSKFTDLGLLKGSWPIIGQSEDWGRENWPLPAFGRVSGNKAFRCIYSDDQMELVSAEECTEEETAELPSDDKASYVYVSAVLSRIVWQQGRRRSRKG